MHPQHVSPEESVEIHKEIRSKFTLGVHWGTFKQMGCFEVITLIFLLITDTSYLEVLL